MEETKIIVTKENYASLDRTTLTNGQKGRQTFFRNEAKREAEALRKKELGIANCQNCYREYGKDALGTYGRFCSFKCYFFSHASSSACTTVINTSGEREYLPSTGKSWMWHNLDASCFFYNVPSQVWIYWVDKKQGSKEFCYTARQAAYALFYTEKNKELNFEEEYEDSLECPKNEECINPYHFKDKYVPTRYERFIKSKISDKDLEKFEQTLRSRLYWSISVGFIEGESEEDIEYYLEMLSDLNDEKRKKHKDLARHTNRSIFKDSNENNQRAKIVIDEQS